MKKSIAVLTLLSVLSAPAALANSSETSNGYERQFRSMFKGLDLTSSQRQDIGQIMRELRQDNSIYRGEKQNFRQDMRALMDSPVWDEGKAQSLISSKISSSTEQKINRAEARHKAYQVLTQEQRDMLSANREAKKAKRDGKRMLNFLDKKANLSDEQYAQIEALINQQVTQISAFSEEIQLQKSEGKALLTAATFDEDAYRALLAQSEQTQIDIGLIKAKTRFDMRQILTEEQLKVLGNTDRKKRWGKRFQSTRQL